MRTKWTVDLCARLLCLALLTFFLVLYYTGAFSDKPKDSQTSVRTMSVIEKQNIAAKSARVGSRMHSDGNTGWAKEDEYAEFERRKLRGNGVNEEAKVSENVASYVHFAGAPHHLKDSNGLQPPASKSATNASKENATNVADKIRVRNKTADDLEDTKDVVDLTSSEAADDFKDNFNGTVRNITGFAKPNITRKHSHGGREGKNASISASSDIGVQRNESQKQSFPTQIESPRTEDNTSSSEENAPETNVRVSHKNMFEMKVHANLSSSNRLPSKSLDLPSLDRIAGSEILPRADEELKLKQAKIQSGKKFLGDPENRFVKDQLPFPRAVPNPGLAWYLVDRVNHRAKLNRNMNGQTGEGAALFNREGQVPFRDHSLMKTGNGGNIYGYAGRHVFTIPRKNLNRVHFNRLHPGRIHSSNRSDDSWLEKIGRNISDNVTPVNNQSRSLFLNHTFNNNTSTKTRNNSQISWNTFNKNVTDIGKNKTFNMDDRHDKTRLSEMLKYSRLRGPPVVHSSHQISRRSTNVRPGALLPFLRVKDEKVSSDSERTPKKNYAAYFHNSYIFSNQPQWSFSPKSKDGIIVGPSDTSIAIEFLDGVHEYFQESEGKEYNEEVYNNPLEDVTKEAILTYRPTNEQVETVPRIIIALLSETDVSQEDQNSSFRQSLLNVSEQNATAESSPKYVNLSEVSTHEMRDVVVPNNTSSLSDDVLGSTGDKDTYLNSSVGELRTKPDNTSTSSISEGSANATIARNSTKEGELRTKPDNTSTSSISEGAANATTARNATKNGELRTKPDNTSTSSISEAAAIATIARNSTKDGELRTKPDNTSTSSISEDAANATIARNSTKDGELRTKSDNTSTLSISEGAANATMPRNSTEDGYFTSNATVTSLDESQTVGTNSSKPLESLASKTGYSIESTNTTFSSKQDYPILKKIKSFLGYFKTPTKTANGNVNASENAFSKNATNSSPLDTLDTLKKPSIGKLPRLGDSSFNSKGLLNKPSVSENDVKEKDRKYELNSDSSAHRRKGGKTRLQPVNKNLKDVYFSNTKRGKTISKPYGESASSDLKEAQFSNNNQTMLRNNITRQSLEQSPKKHLQNKFQDTHIKTEKGNPKIVTI